ncbi:ArsR/SmtB family transcription factor [Amnibacterium setariae]|uniref:ArsR family transcriptional regulator n=1 Tax=Amnibacterium setariae TaxID=2306585 RepID=A0A3A1UDR0_9MICO|nr:metalloregulator ArsR/SmtB family transcription factor [Amnibacterium setariae]RIX31216.1 ArsR family transcriptional regulator [Amnibacterium setariae]
MVVDVVPSQDEIDRIFHALADVTRRDILARVVDREQSVSALARPYAMSLPAVQKHVAVLERAGLVGRTRVGREQQVHAVPERIRVAREQLDRYEALWRHRVAAMDRLLAEDPSEQKEQ